MTEKTTKIIFWASTAILALMFLSSGIMYFVQYDAIAEEFTKLGFPTFIMYPLAIAKILGAIAILVRKVKVLQYLAYAGIFYDILLAFGAHFSINDGEQWGTLVPLVICIVSYVFARKMEAIEG